MKAVICPICKGDGKIRAPTTPYREMITCHGCGGKGWVEVHTPADDYEAWIGFWKSCTVTPFPSPGSTAGEQL